MWSMKKIQNICHWAVFSRAEPLRSLHFSVAPGKIHKAQRSTLSVYCFITDPNWQINTYYIDTKCPIFWHLCLYTIRYTNIICFPPHWYSVWFTSSPEVFNTPSIHVSGVIIRKYIIPTPDHIIPANHYRTSHQLGWWKWKNLSLWKFMIFMRNLE